MFLQSPKLRHRVNTLHKKSPLCLLVIYLCTFENRIGHLLIQMLFLALCRGTKVLKSSTFACIFMDVALMISLWHISCSKPTLYTISCPKCPQSWDFIWHCSEIKLPVVNTKSQTAGLSFYTYHKNCIVQIRFSNPAISDYVINIIFDVLIQMPGTRLYGSLTGTLSVNSISISKSLMSAMSRTLQKKSYFCQSNIFFTIICLAADKWLKSNFSVQSKFSELSFFFSLSYWAQ